MLQRTSFFKGLFLGLLVILYILFEWFLTQDYLYFEIKVNGDVQTVERGMRVYGLASIDPVIRAGDLIDVTGQVINTGGGEPPVFLNDGHPVSKDVLISPDTSFTAIPGADRYEEMKVIVKELKAPTEFYGKGPLFVERQPALPGTEIIYFGEVSHKLSSRFNLAPQPLLIERTKVTKGKYVALTFDDGPIPAYTIPVLKILKAQNVKGTFFVLGKYARQFPWVVRAIVKDHNVIGNHSYSHAQLHMLSEALVLKELTSTRDEVSAAGGGPVKFFRPPYGSYNTHILNIAASQGYVPVFWNVDTRDWTGIKADAIYEEVVGHTQPGSIILMHDGGGTRSETVKALNLIIPKLKSMGYTFLTLDEMLAMVSGDASSSR